ncbi:hypothetical protein KR51_00022130 [Rubidibacter lacunae KORDI 51-2]|uniref:Uncharacterized protein n=1 Tax=Rubidibacter lacunae KORDI 51-2 TaxID=582515 RepID=U5DHV4_9CHRO|nr:hypothetical protein KR51_00022130 [Rubidibacter lacunae KORDI 51-2]
MENGILYSSGLFTSFVVCVLQIGITLKEDNAFFMVADLS